jgi:hypothetical protein
MTTAHHRNSGASTLATLALVAAVLAAAPAAAYEIQVTDGGNPVRWGVSEVVLTLDGSLASLGPMDRVGETIAAAFERWVVDADLPIDFTVVRGICGEPGYHQGETNENCLMARHLGQDSSHTGATTRVSYASPSGEIVDGDILFNLDAGQWSLDGEAGALDLAEVALHESGHLIGMAHSDVGAARMFPMMSYGPDDRDGLHADDIDGATRLYAGFVDPTMALSCSVAAAGSSRPGLAGLILAVLAACVATRSIRRE